MTTPSEFTKVLYDWSSVFMQRSFRDFKRFLDESGLSVSQIITLMHLHYGGVCAISDISTHLGVTNAASSQLVDRLVQAGYLARREDPVDRRARQITLTDRGQALIEQAIDARRSWMETLTTTLSPERQEAIVQALILLTEAARQLEQPHARV
jgi:DNA-binding MarR family transcriptional regulator